MASGPVRITDPADSRVDDYRSLHDAKIRRRMEEGGDGDPGFFVAEGGHAVERLLASGRRLRSVLLDPIRLEALGPALDGVDAPVLVADQPTLRAVAGFPVHRGVLAAADRRLAIPMRHPEDSLNVGSAAAVAFYALGQSQEPQKPH